MVDTAHFKARRGAMTETRSSGRCWAPPSAVSARRLGQPTALGPTALPGTSLTQPRNAAPSAAYHSGSRWPMNPARPAELLPQALPRLADLVAAARFRGDVQDCHRCADERWSQRFSERYCWRALALASPPRAKEGSDKAAAASLRRLSRKSRSSGSHVESQAWSSGWSPGPAKPRWSSG